MSLKFKLDKKKIFLLYQYYLLFDNSFCEEDVWIKDFWEKEKILIEKIERKMKITWKFYRLPPLEKATLTYAAYKIIFDNINNHQVLLINQIINFSKKYLEENKYKYINKVLDLIYKESLLTDSILPT